LKKGETAMNSQQWFLLGAFLIGMGIVILAVSQIALGRWLKRFMQE